MRLSLSQEVLDQASDSIRKANERFIGLYPGERPDRQPVHTVYGGAQLFKATTVQRLGSLALESLEEYAPNFASFARAIGLPGAEDLPSDPDRVDRLDEALSEDEGHSHLVNPSAQMAHTVYHRVLDKLQREPVEDFRIDFEDGFGVRPDAEEDAEAVRAASELAKAVKTKQMSPFFGIRTKSFSPELYSRSIRTLDLFISTLVQELGELPEGFFLTLPKITSEEHVEVLANLLDALEAKLGLPPGATKVELMIELTQSMFNSEGAASLFTLAKAARGRCVGAHFGTYDYTASCNVTAHQQHMSHLSCDFARMLMQVAYGGTGIWLSDGATNVMPVGPHNADELTMEEIVENRRVVHEAWRLHARHVHRSLELGFYQGWDLHPAQLPTRYAAIYAFFLEGLEAASARLKNFVEKAAQATLVGDVFDDAATGQGLLNFFLRGVACGAITEEEALETGLTLEELRGRSFVKILENRK